MPKPDVVYISPRGRLCRYVPSAKHADQAEAPRYTFLYGEGGQGFTFTAANLPLMRVLG